MLGIELNSAIRAIGDAGIDYIELWGEVPHAYHDWVDRNQLRDTLSAYDFYITIHAPFTDLNPASPFQPVRDSVARTLKDFVNFADYLGASWATFHPGSVHSQALVSQAPGTSAGVLKEVVKEAGGRLGVNLENMGKSRPPYYLPLGTTLESIGSLLSAVEGARMTMDPGHAHVNGVDILALYNHFKDQIREIHLSDNSGVEDEHLVLGRGTAKVNDLMWLVRETDIYVCLELNPFKYSPDEAIEATKQLMTAHA